MNSLDAWLLHFRSSGTEKNRPHKHTLKALCQTTDKGSGPVLWLHSTGSITIVTGRRKKRKLIKDSGSLFGNHVTTNLAWGTDNSQGRNSFAGSGLGQVTIKSSSWSLAPL